jgi:hypothetical protein
MPRDGSVFDLFSERENESRKSASRVFQDVLTRWKERLLLTSAAQALSEARKARCKFVFSYNIHKL